MARSLAAHSRRLAARDTLETIRRRVLPFVLAALVGVLAAVLAIALGGGGL
jgi:uncharacterized protein involved in exopolysaccharide biosynthesis